MNPFGFAVNAFLTVPFLAACAWAQWLDALENFAGSTEDPAE